MIKRNFFNKALAIALAAVMTTAGAGTVLAEAPADAQTAQGVGVGIEGEDVVVEVTADENGIYDVVVTEHNETDGVGTKAVDAIPGAIVAAQSLDVEAVAGATVTTEAIINATAEALESMGLDPASYVGGGEDVAEEASTEAAAAEDVTIDTDVVVVGAGGAGMTAAIEIADAGKNVVVLESQPMEGGNSVRSTGGLNAGKTDLQDQNEFDEAAGVEATLTNAAENYADNAVITDLAATVSEQWAAYQENPEGYFDSVELFELDTMVGGKGINDPELVATLVENSADAIAWLESVNAPLTSVSQFGGASVKRIHRPVDEEGQTVSVGSYIVPRLKSNLEERGVEIMLETTATEILTDADGNAVGVVAEGANGETVTVNAAAVVLTTGGFGAALDMVTSYKPELDGFMTTNAPGILGQGIQMAEAIGAATVDMDQIQIHPTVEAETASLITEGLRGDGAILVNAEGERFVNEVDTRDKVSAAEIAQTGSYSWLIVDQAMVDASAVIQGYVKRGFTISGETYEELAEALEIPADTFAATMETWNGYVAEGSDPDFSRTAFANALDTAPYYAIKVTAGVHHTMGGLKINSDTQVLDAEGNAIGGLYAAGEITGGVHGGNRLGGNAVADFVVFGRIAGQQAAAYVG